MTIMLFLGAWGKMIHEKTGSKKFHNTVPLNICKPLSHKNKKNYVIQLEGACFILLIHKKSMRRILSTSLLNYPCL
jgi:hypothetical protein